MKTISFDQAQGIAGGNAQMEADKAAMESAVLSMSASNSVNEAVSANAGAHVDSGGRE